MSHPDSSLPVMEDDSRRIAHLVGVCGAGMKALAEVMLDAGWSLTGSDLSSPNPSMKRLIERGLVFHEGHHESHVTDSTLCLVYSSAVPLTNSERIEAKRRDLPQLTYSQAVGQLMKKSTGVCIAGTHGKSTTTAMTASILDAARRLESVVLGAELRDGGRSGWSGVGDLFVVESCEFQQSFFDFLPKYASILSIEPDHFDCYPDLKSLESAFCEFASRTSDDGVLLVNDDCSLSLAVSANARTKAKRVTFGSNDTADWVAVKGEHTSTGSRFQLSHHGQIISQIELLLHGKHNISNALAAAALCAEIGVSHEVIQNSLSQFRGIRRRLEHVGEWHGATFMDDYAHHPTAVRATLEALRNASGKRRIICVFQPHQVARTRALMDDFATSFSHADVVMIAPVFAARELVHDEPQTVSQELADRISCNGVSAHFFPSLDQIVSTLEDATRPGDVIVTMGAGDIDRIHHEFTQRVQ